MVDDLAKLRAFLAANSGLTALTGTRIWARRRAPKENWKPGDGACVVLSRRGGQGNMNQTGKVLSFSYQLKCYGGGSTVPAQELSAANVYRAVYDALNNANSFDILGCQPEGMVVDLEEPDTGWPYSKTIQPTAVPTPSKATG